jgi:hypothetical protein
MPCECQDRKIAARQKRTGKSACATYERNQGRSRGDAGAAVAKNASQAEDAVRFAKKASTRFRISEADWA